MHPTGDASLLTGATSTSFDATAVNNENPYLVFDNTTNVWKTTEDTPLYKTAITSETVNEDLEGQGRPSASNPGADHYSMESIRFAPLTPEEVGPNAYEDINTSTSEEYEISEPLIYPVPADNILHLSSIGSKVNKVEIISLAGRIVLSLKIQGAANGLTINTSKLANGMYVVKFSKNNNYSESTRIVIQH